MPNKIKVWLFTCIIAGLIILAACQPSPKPTATPQASEPEGHKLVVGDISDEVAETINGTQPLADYLAAQLGEFGIAGAEVKIAPDMDTMIQWVNNGQVDIYFDSPYPALVIRDVTGAQPILRRLKFGVPTYYSVFFVRNDSAIKSLDDLRGKVVAFEEPFSTSGYMLPLAYLIQQGFEPVEAASLDTDVPPEKVGYTFSTADNTTIQWVVSEKAPAGAIDNITYQRLPEATQKELRIIAKTDEVPRQLVLLQPNMDPALAAAIKTALLHMNETEEGKRALEIFLTTEFDEFPEGSEAALAKMQELFQLVNNH